MSDGTAAPAAAATRRKLEHTKRTDNFLKSVGENAVWAMGATALKVALRDTTLVDAAWLVELAATEGGIVPRCQDVPKHAKVSLKEMEKWPGHPPSVAVLVIS